MLRAILQQARLYESLPAVVQNPDISKQPGALPLRRRTRLCFQLSGSPIRILCLSPIGVKLAGIGSALESCRICKEQMSAAAAFQLRMLEIRAASRLARQSARKNLEQRPSGRWAAKTKWATLVCQSTVGEGSLTSMNPISSQRRCPGTKLNLIFKFDWN